MSRIMDDIIARRRKGDSCGWDDWDPWEPVSIEKAFTVLQISRYSAWYRDRKKYPDIVFVNE